MCDICFRRSIDHLRTLSLNHKAQGRALHPTPLEVGISQHWLAVAGCQPTSLENAQPKRTSAISNDLPGVSRQALRRASPPAGLQGKTGNSGARQPSHDAAGTDDGAVHISASLPLKHSLPGELHLYFSMVRRALQQSYGGAADGVLQAQAVCATLATDPGESTAICMTHPTVKRRGMCTCWTQACSHCCPTWCPCWLMRWARGWCTPDTCS
jgi:hypothetical protein